MAFDTAILVGWDRTPIDRMIDRSSWSFREGMAGMEWMNSLKRLICPEKEAKMQLKKRANM